MSPSPAENLSRTPSAPRKNTHLYSASQQTVEEPSAASTTNVAHLTPGESCKGRRGSCQSTTTTLLAKEGRGKSDLFKGLNKRLQVIQNADSVPSKDINSNENAKRLARTLFYDLQGSGDRLVVQDFYPYFDTGEERFQSF